MKLFTLMKSLAAILICIYCSAAQSQLPGLTYNLPGDHEISVAAGDQNAPDISSGNGSQLVVWTDERANPYIYNEYETSTDIYGLRLDPSGNPVDPVSFAVTAARGSQTNPKVAWNGTSWLVVFQSTGLSGTGFYYQSSLAAVRVAGDGTVLDSEPIPLFGLASSQYTVASDGVGWVVASQGNDVTGDIVAVRIDANGTVLDPPTRTIVPDESVNGAGVRLSYANGSFLLTFINQGQTGAVLFDSQLNTLGEPFILLDRAIADLASNGSEHYIVWNLQRPDFSLAVMGSRVNADASRLDGDGVDISAAAEPFGNVIGVVWDGMNWRASWSNSNALRVAQINAAGQVLNSGGTELTGPQSGPTAGTGTGSLQVVWPVFQNNEYDVYGATIDEGNHQVAGGGLSTAHPRQYRADIAAGASGYMITYRSAFAGESRIMAQPLDINGNAITTSPLQLDSGPLFNGPGSPSVAWNGSLYLVSWANTNGIVSVRIDQSGNLLDPTPVVVMSPGFGPTDVAAVGDDFLVVGRQFGFTVEYIFPIGVRVSGANGTVLDPVPLLLGSTSQSPFTIYTRALAVTAVGNRWLVAWHTNASHDNPLAQSVGVFVESNGTLAAPFLIHGFFSTNGGNGIFDLGLASDGVNALFTQSQELTSGIETDLLGHIIQTDGSVQPMLNLTPWKGNQYRPSISFNGSDYIVVFQDQKNRLAPHTLDQIDARGDLYGMRIDISGAVIDPQGFLIDDSPLSETDLAIASRETDSLIAASQMNKDAFASNYRIFLSEVIDGADRFPVAVTNASVVLGDAPLEVFFDSTGSSDPEGGPITYLWDFMDGTTSSSPNPTHKFGTPGEYPVLMTVTDALGQSASQAIMVQVTDPNQLPIAVASAPRLSGPTPLNVTLYADGSYDPDGSLGNIEWLSGDGRTYFGSPAFFSYNTEGTYTVTLRVHDSRGGIGKDTLTIEVGGENQSPVAQAVATPISGDAPLLVAFSSNGSSDGDGSIISYAWDFGDGSSGSGANPSHIYTSIGTYVATLTVTDNSGAAASDQVTITVNDVSGTALLTSIDLTTSTKRGIRSLQGAVHVTNGNGGIERSAIVTVFWTFPDGSKQTQVQYSDRKGQATFNLPAPDDGNYLLTITNVTKSGFVFDPNDSEISDSITVGNAGGDTTPPAAPGGLTASAGNAQVSLDWADNGETDLAGYHVERANAAAGPFTRLTTAALNTSQYTDTGLTNGLTYFYRAFALDTSGNESSSSSIVSATPQGGGPQPPESIYVSSIDLGTVNAGKGEKYGSALVTVLDNNGNPVSGATVNGKFSGGYTDTAAGSTQSNGALVLQTSAKLKGAVSFGFCVTSISHPDLNYVAADNNETCDLF